MAATSAGPAPATKTAATETSPKKAKASTKAAKASTKPSTKASGKKGVGGPSSGKKSVIDEEFLIEGKLEKPNAYFILRRSSVDFDWARLGATFSPLVLESVQDPLF